MTDSSEGQRVQLTPRARKAKRLAVALQGRDDARLLSYVTQRTIQSLLGGEVDRRTGEKVHDLSVLAVELHALIMLLARWGDPTERTNVILECHAHGFDLERAIDEGFELETALYEASALLGRTFAEAAQMGLRRVAGGPPRGEVRR